MPKRLVKSRPKVRTKQQIIAALKAAARKLGRDCVALGPPLGHPSVTQRSPMGRLA